jgi:hypothetical protein
MEILVQEMDEENEGDANNLDDFLWVFGQTGQHTTWRSTHSPIQVACGKYYAVAIIVATAATAAKHLTISGAIL